MKMCLPCLAILALLLALPATASETLVIEAPWLVGTVISPSSATDGVLELPDDVTDLLSVSLEVSVLVTEGTMICYDDPTIYPALIGVGASFHNDCINSYTGFFYWQVSDFSGEVTISAPVVRSWGGNNPAPWSCWLEQPLNIQVFWLYVPVGICGFHDEPSVAITDARFTFEVERVVPASSSTWSTVKALYR